MNKEIEIIEKAIKEIQKMNNIWRFNYSLGFRNGDVFGSSWENEKLLKPNKKGI